MTEVHPTGKITRIGIDDLFFSSTGPRGVIRQANSVFVRLSGYPRERLIGAPHSIVRHPAMPAGVYWTMWDALEDGRPFAGYVHNLAADGSAYTVFATVTPIPQGYLSVRITPSRPEHLDQANAIYEKLDDLERVEKRAGLTRRKAARASAVLLTELMREAGFDSYEEFQWRALADEVARREELSPGIPVRPDATRDLGTMLHAIGEVHAELRHWSSSQESLAELTTTLQRTGGRLRTQLDHTAAIEQLITDRPDTPAARNEGLLLWKQMQEIVHGYVVDLVEILGRLERHGAETRFRIALAQLHTAMIGKFTAELIDGDTLSLESAPAIATLAEALQQELTAMVDHYAAHQALAAESASAIERSGSIISIPRRLLMHWRNEAAAGGSGAEAELSEQIASSVEGVGTALEDLSRIVGQVRALSTPLDPSRARQLLATIVQSSLLIRA
ncbi:PAS domain-containing protein [Leucobacter sp. CSA2]|uniref:PAS domain-containing protein n=1 Tax=Leucobacter edaphi TaxID=2796472 RepID=A0A934QFP0_9MICO|nr:PAS domain-containing protein [Leucobacter edaphi]MBK0422752.1 PAS domain-containing protein [Leucobacter edaphi]